MKQLQVDEGALDEEVRSDGGLEPNKPFGDVISAFVLGENGKAECWLPNQDENEFRCGTSPNDRERGNAIPWPVGNAGLGSSFGGVAVHVNEGSKNSVVLEDNPISMVSSKVSSPRDGVVFADDDLCLLPSTESDGIDQFVSKANMGLLFPSRGIEIAWESNRNGEHNTSSIMISWLTMLALILEVLVCLFALGLPALDDGLYLQSVPQVRQREHMGLALLHLTLAKKHPSQDALNL